MSRPKPKKLGRGTQRPVALHRGMGSRRSAGRRPFIVEVDAESGLRTIYIRSSEPWSVNMLIRASYHLRNARRDGLMKRFADRRPAGWTPLAAFQVDALMHVSALRDEVELGGCLKIEMDALERTKFILNDGPRCCQLGVIHQVVARPRGVIIRLQELAEAPKRRPAPFSPPRTNQGDE